MEIYFSQFWRLKVQDQGVRMVMLWGRISSRRKISHCVLTLQKDKKPISGASFIRVHTHFYEDSVLTTQSPLRFPAFSYITPVCSVAKSCPTLCNPWTVAHQAPLSLGFSRHKSWSELPCSSPGELPDPWVESTSLTSSPALANGFFTTSIAWEAGLF